MPDSQPRQALSAWPQYVCAILEDSEGRLLLESRPADARLAAGKLTCFGGRREADESPEECLRRELREELGWEPPSLVKQVELWVGGAPVAWFYHAALDVVIDRLQVLAGTRAELLSRRQLSVVPLSPWHEAVLVAWQEGRAVAELEA